MPASTTITIPDLPELTAAAAVDELRVIDKSDTSVSVNGRDKRATVQNLVETSPVRPSDNLSVTQTVTAWIAEFRNAIADLTANTQQATTVQSGVTRYSTDAEAATQTETAAAITPANLGSLVGSTSVAGLIQLATDAQVAEGQEAGLAISPAALFASILGPAIFGASANTFRIPVRNTTGDVKVEMRVLIGEHTFTSPASTQDPTSNFNHIHPVAEFTVTYPEAIPTQVLAVIPIPHELNPASYIDASNLWTRVKTYGLTSAVLRSTRVNGVSAGEQVAVKYVVIGY